MAVLLALSLLAAPLGGVTASPVEEGRTAVTATARASVRILPGARIILNDQAEAPEHRFIDARITVEDGSQREAKLVEFQ